ncbi:MAG TPA: LysR family transcriptional regulator [Acidobacteriaceae bacterium]|nr:LysR family transcriptional regulator [Acidobacteriaceae bacterium]
MELHQLRYVCAIAETGSFSRAAEDCEFVEPVEIYALASNKSPGRENCPR